MLREEVREIATVQSLPVILVAEDDQDVQTVIEDTLSAGGFELSIAVTGQEAINLLKSKNVEYRALVTDIHLGGEIDGWQVARIAREMDPHFPVVYMTGAAADEWSSQGVPNSIMLAKPFAPAQLVTAVSQLLNASPPVTE